MKTVAYCTALLGGLLMYTTGCSTVNTVENADKAGARNMIADQRVITDPGLNHKVAIVGVNTAQTPGGLLKVQVEVENRSQSSQKFLYRFEWFDLDGMQVNNTLSAQVPEQLDGRESKMLWSVVPNERCKDFRLKIFQP